MTNSWDQPLQAATLSTFEDLALVVPTGDPDEAQAARPLVPGVAVAFRGPLAGRVTVHVTDDVLRVIGANMLGEMDDPAPEVLRDALGEVANVIAGNVLPAVAGREKVFDLAAPAAADVPADRPAAVCRFGIDGGRAEVAVYLAEAKAA